MSKICTINEESLQFAAQIINAGGVIVVPTDTVYGVACDPFNEAAVAKIYQLKRRPRTKALQILMSSVSDLEKLGLYLPSPLDVPVSYTHLTLPTNHDMCRSRWSPYH